MRKISTTAFTAALLAVALAGCVGGQDTDSTLDTNLPDIDPSSLDELVNFTLDVDAALAMVFEESIVDAAVDVSQDIYEPTLDVCDDGSIYVTGHTILVDTTGAPVFSSHDDGETWEQLPWFRDQTMPEPVHGATPPVTDEIFLACGDDGWLYGADITAFAYPVNAWSGYGSMHAYYNPNAYDEFQAATQTTQDCQPAPAKDRPWAAYSDGRLLLVNNPGSGKAQIGVMDVPPTLPAGIGLAGMGEVTWNMCAGPDYHLRFFDQGEPAVPILSIPGIPDMREDGLFAVPQRASNLGYQEENAFYLILGNSDDVMDVEVVKLFNVTSSGEITSWYGQAVFDAEGTLFAGISNNTWEFFTPDSAVSDAVNCPCTRGLTGGLRLVASTDGGATFQEHRFTSDKPLRHVYMDGNPNGPGALVVWTTDGDEPEGDEDQLYDWYAAHLLVDGSGTPVLRNASLIIDEGPQPSAHVTGAAVGPDGRGYTAMYRTTSLLQKPDTPLSVYIQRDGPTLPVADAAE